MLSYDIPDIFRILHLSFYCFWILLFLFGSRVFVTFSRLSISKSRYSPRLSKKMSDRDEPLTEGERDSGVGIPASISSDGAASSEIDSGTPPNPTGSPHDTSPRPLDESAFVENGGKY